MILDPRHSREKMVREQIETHNVRDKRVLDAMRKVPRHLFVEEALASQAYENRPLHIGYGQTISQPLIVAAMSELLEAQPGMRVLEIGTGSGYQAVILAEMGLEVYTVERIRELYLNARERFFNLKYFSIKIKQDDGTLGWPEEAPFDRIIVTAGGPKIPQPLIDQLADPGILVIPVGRLQRIQDLIVLRKAQGEIKEQMIYKVEFVDLKGEHGW